MERYELSVKSAFSVRALKIISYFFGGIAGLIALANLVLFILSFYRNGNFGYAIEKSFLMPILNCAVISMLFYFFSHSSKKARHYSYDSNFLYIESSLESVKVPLENIRKFHKPVFQVNNSNNWEIHYLDEGKRMSKVKFNVTYKKDNFRRLKRILDKRGVKTKVDGLFSSWMFD